MDNKPSELSKPVAEVVSKFGDPEAFGEREVKLLIGIQQMAYGTKFYSQEYVSALLAELESAQQRIAELERYAKERDAENESLALTVGKLRAKLATPVRLPKRWDVSGQVNPPRIVQVQFEQQNRTHDQCAEAIRSAGFTFTVKGGEQ